MQGASEQVRLLYADAGGHAATNGKSRRLSAVEIPDGASFLLCNDDGNPPVIVREKPNADHRSLVVQPCQVNRAPHLLMANPQCLPIRVNGNSTPLISVLREGDEVLLSPNLLLFVTTFRRPFVGAADESITGKTCPLCQLRVAANVIVYVCHRCGTALHCQGNDTAEADRLQCANLSDCCPTCSARIEFDEGYSYRPKEVCDE